jgi:YgiT-type zinc finger domain-containing protein
MEEGLVDATVTYTLEYEGRIYIIEHVPAKVSDETGEQYFEPETVERVRALIKSNRKPDRLVETPVYEFA